MRTTRLSLHILLFFSSREKYHLMKTIEIRMRREPQQLEDYNIMHMVTLEKLFLIFNLLGRYLHLSSNRHEKKILKD